MVTRANRLASPELPLVFSEVEDSDDPVFTGSCPEHEASSNAEHNRATGHAAPGSQVLPRNFDSDALSRITGAKYSGRVEGIQCLLEEVLLRARISMHRNNLIVTHGSAAPHPLRFRKHSLSRFSRAHQRLLKDPDTNSGPSTPPSTIQNLGRLSNNPLDYVAPWKNGQCFCLPHRADNSFTAQVFHDCRAAPPASGSGFAVLRRRA